MGECLFCRIVSGEVPSDRVYEDDEILAFKDINPQAPIHVLLIPKKHMPTVLDMGEEDMRLVGRLFKVAGDIAREMGIAESGFRLVVNCNRDAGQAVFHFHVHLLGGRGFSWPPG
jgi:histidine triad (HIT) family protein